MAWSGSITRDVAHPLMPLHTVAVLAVLVLICLGSLGCVLHNWFERGPSPDAYAVKAHMGLTPVEQQSPAPSSPIPPLQHPCHHATYDIALTAPLTMVALLVIAVAIPMTSGPGLLQVGIRPDVPPPQLRYR